MNEMLQQIGRHELEDYQQILRGWGYSDVLLWQEQDLVDQSGRQLQQQATQFQRWSVQLLDVYTTMTSGFLPAEILTATTPAVEADSVVTPTQRHLPNSAAQHPNASAPQFTNHSTQVVDEKTAVPTPHEAQQPRTTNPPTWERPEVVAPTSLDKKIKAKEPINMLLADQQEEARTQSNHSTEEIPPTSPTFRSISGLSSFVNTFQQEEATSVKSSTPNDAETVAHQHPIVRPSAVNGRTNGQQQKQNSTPQGLQADESMPIRQPTVGKDHSALTWNTPVDVDEVLTELSEKIRREYQRFYGD